MNKNITFSLPAEAVQGASLVKLLGDFNDWNADNAIILEKKEDGSYAAVANLEVGKTYHYRFLLNDGRWVNDYNAQQYEYVPGLYVDNCVITISATNEDKKANQPVSTVKASKTATAAAPATKLKAEPAAKKATKKAVAKEAAPKAEKAKSADAKTTVTKVVKKIATKAKK